MIILGKTNMVTERFDYMRLLCDEEKAVYLSTDVYEQCVIITHRFDGYIKQIIKILDVGTNNAGAIEWFYANAPEPLNILAPFLGLVDVSIDDLGADREEAMYGFLHYMSNLINFNEFLLTSDVVRKDVTISKVNLTAYRKSWDILKIELFHEGVKRVECTEDLLKGLISTLSEAVQSFSVSIEKLVGELQESKSSLSNSGTNGNVINVYAGGGGGVSTVSSVSDEKDGSKAELTSEEDVAEFFDSIIEDMDWGSADFTSKKDIREAATGVESEQETPVEGKVDLLSELSSLFG